MAITIVHLHTNRVYTKLYLLMAGQTKGGELILLIEWPRSLSMKRIMSAMMEKHIHPTKETSKWTLGNFSFFALWLNFLQLREWDSPSRSLLWPLICSLMNLLVLGTLSACRIPTDVWSKWPGPLFGTCDEQ